MSAARLVVSLGCPCGVGPEVSVVAAAAAVARPRGRVLLVGDEGAIRAAARSRRLAASMFVGVSEPARGWSVPRGKVAVWQPGPDLPASARAPGRPTRASGAAQLAWVDAACDLTSSGEADAMVTGPVSKDAIARSGAPGSRGFLGHTEHLQRRLRAREVVMAFWAPRLVTALATTHIALAEVPRAVTSAAVARASYWLVKLLATLGKAEPRVVVAALNPHAGEAGLLGHEERTTLRPGVTRARSRLARAGLRATLEGPVGAETAFRLALEGRWDGVVAMYHDQATIPMKVAGFGDAVNVSLGLPIVRTSVDHGTGYDRAGRGDADARGMAAALDLAARCVRGAQRESAP